MDGIQLDYDEVVLVDEATALIDRHYRRESSRAIQSRSRRERREWWQGNRMRHIPDYEFPGTMQISSGRQPHV